MVKSGNFHCVKEVLQADVDINIANKDGYTSLMAAVDVANATIVNLLLSKGAEVNAKNDDDKTAFESCCKSCISVKTI